MCGQRLIVVELINLFIYLFRSETLKVNIMEETKKYLSESQTNIKNHGQIFNERTNVNVKYLKMYT